METGVYLISACLMTYRPLLERIGRGRSVGRLSNAEAANAHKANKSGEPNSDIPLSPRSGIHSMGTRSRRLHQLEDRGGENPGMLMTTGIRVGKDPESVAGQSDLGDEALFD